MPAGYGLANEQQGIVVINLQTRGVFLQGDQELYDDLQRLFAEWQALGKPEQSDYSIEFIPLTDPLPSLPDLSWTLERKFYRQIFTLPERS